MSVGFILFPDYQNVPKEYQDQIPKEVPEKGIIGVAIGPASLLNMHARSKIEAYFGSCQRLFIFAGTQRYRDLIVFMRDKHLPPYDLKQTTMELK